jgi:hypothetical protein
MPPLDLGEASGCSQSAIAGECPQGAFPRVFIWIGYLDRRETELVACVEGEEQCDVCRRADGAEEAEEIEEESESSENGSSNEEEMDTVEAERDEKQRVSEQQQQARRGPRQALIQQRQQGFADVEWLCRQLAWWTKLCGICEKAGGGQSGHDMRQCWRTESLCRLCRLAYLVGRYGRVR